ncbi:TOMM system kinase/cyclase fusion protein [Paracidovorax anthurii]|uniref:TOMM system kinase/cyclase fusion protein n=1 Tax=Paracidovorax anthurii TaxID=78229 RepID=A0A328YZ44_9BURK|nr:TOMM system kinase/cyclase fusion protein [Paracidovorax anthurii]RAR79148.1 TOMM system kinase/cyclase fusion protein [Paracidovorax anthurii]
MSFRPPDPGQIRETFVTHGELAQRYVLQDVIGTGSYGTVFSAVQHQTRQKVVLKFVRIDEDERLFKRFRREIAACARLHHPHIVQLLDEGVCGPYVFAVFEFVPGVTLRQMLQRQGAFPAAEAGRLMLQVLDAIACAHDAGIAHRDLKPENIMIGASGLTSHAKVLDFGISTLLPGFGDAHSTQLTRDGEYVGTPAYSAPEQLRGEAVTPQVDLYAWGLIFLECLTGRVLTGESTAEIYQRQLSPQEISLPRAIQGHPLAELLRSALRKRPQDRASSARQLWEKSSMLRLDDLVGVLRVQASSGASGIAPTVAFGTPHEEKRQLTLLYCGVYFAQPPEAGDEDAAERQEMSQRNVLRRLIDIAVQRGGTLGGTLGTHFLVTLGYSVNAESDARQTVQIARELVRSCAGAGGDEVCWDVRVGLHTGTVLIESGSVVPCRALNIAMLMEGAASDGQIVVSEAARQRLRHHAKFAPQGGVRLSGSATETPCYGLLEDEGAGASPVWQRESVGRWRELLMLRRNWRSACRGEGRAVVVRGEAGIGKSCLSETFRWHVESREGVALHATCWPEQENSALAPMLALIRAQCGDAGDADDVVVARLSRMLESSGCDVERVLPIFCVWLSLRAGAHHVTDIAPALQKALLMEASLRWLKLKAGEAPVLLIVEDLHWADSATLDWLAELTEAMAHERCMLLVTARPEWEAPPRMHERLQSLELGRLGPAEAAAMVRHVLAPRQVSRAVIDHVVARTDGVALFVQELARMLLETCLVERGGQWDFEEHADLDAIPITLRDSLESRFMQLGSAREVLRWAAIWGRRFDAGLLPDCGLQDVSASLRTLVDVGLLMPAEAAGQYLFRHALIRDAAYDSMLATQRVRMHGVAAEVLLRRRERVRDEEPGVLAHHYALAKDYANAVPAGLAQLRMTQHRSLNDGTITYARSVEDWIDRLDESARWEPRLALNGYVIQALMNKHGWAHPQVEQRIAMSQDIVKRDISVELRVQHIGFMLTYHHVASHRAEVMRLGLQLQELARQRGDAGIRAVASIWIGLAFYSEGQFEEAERFLSEAVDGHRGDASDYHASQLGLDTVSWAQTARALVRWGCGWDAPAREDAEQALERARALAHIPSMGMAMLYKALGHLGRQELHHARQVVDELIELSGRYGLPAFRGYAEVIRCWVADDLEGADAAIEALWNIGCKYCQTYYRAFAAEILARKGRWTEAADRVIHCLQLTEELGEGIYTAELWLQKAKYLLLGHSGTVDVVAALKQAVQVARAGGKHRVEAEALWRLRGLDPASWTDGDQGRLQALLGVRPELEASLR